MKTREIQCKHYECEGACSLGKNANFYGYCQHCQKYEKKHGALPNRTDTRRSKMERINRKEKYD